MAIVLSRATLAALWLVILLAMLFIGWRRESARPYIWAAWPIAAVNFVFYILSTFWRLGWFDPPSAYFFSTISNYRSWATAFTALFIIAPISWELLTGRQS